MTKKVTPDTIIQIKLSYLLTFIGGLLGLILTVGTFFYNTIDKKVEAKVNKEVYEQHKAFMTEKFDDNKHQLDRIETSVESVNNDIKDLLKDKNSGSQMPGNPTIGPPKINGK